MTKQVQDKLASVRWRQRLQSGQHGAVWGLLIAAAGVAVFGAWRWLAHLPISPLWGVAGLGVGTMLGLCIGVLRRQSWQNAARAVDAHYQLKDRTATALQFVEQSELSPLRDLQVHDALDRLAVVRSPEVVSLKPPRTLSYALATSVLAVGLLVMSVLHEPVIAGPSAPLDVVLNQAERIAEELRELEEFAKQEKQTEPEIEKLVEELKAKLDELKQPGVDQREALAKLSEMHAKLQEQQKQYDVATVDAEMKSIADALALAEALASISKPLQEGKYEQAAEQLEKLEAPQLDRQTEKAVKEQLAKVAQSSRDGAQSKLGELAGEMSESLGQDTDKFRESSKKLAGECKSQGRRKKLNDLLKKQCECLGECKSECEGQCENPSQKPSNKKGGKNWGLGASDNAAIDPTANLGGQQKQQLTGKQSDDGETEVETSHAPEGKQDAQRDYRRNFEKYKQMSESVLDSEPIPLGHRQIIRKYFESIRPEADAPKAP